MQSLEKLSQVGEGTQEKREMDPQGFLPARRPPGLRRGAVSLQMHACRG